MYQTNKVLQLKFRIFFTFPLIYLSTVEETNHLLATEKALVTAIGVLILFDTSLHFIFITRILCKYKWTCEQNS